MKEALKQYFAAAAPVQIQEAVKFYARESELVVAGDKITGMMCQSKVWEEIPKSEAMNLRNYSRTGKSFKIQKNSTPIRPKKQLSSTPAAIMPLPVNKTNITAS